MASGDDYADDFVDVGVAQEDAAAAEPEAAYEDDDYADEFTASPRPVASASDADADRLASALARLRDGRVRHASSQSGGDVTSASTSTDAVTVAARSVQAPDHLSGGVSSAPFGGASTATSLPPSADGGAAALLHAVDTLPAPAAARLCRFLRAASALVEASCDEARWESALRPAAEAARGGAAGGLSRAAPSVCDALPPPPSADVCAPHARVCIGAAPLLGIIAVVNFFLASLE
jgi:hypothetical protein